MAAQKQFNQPWNVLEIETLLNDIVSAIGDSTLTATLEEIRTMIASLSGGVHLRGAVNYYSNLPNDPEEGDAYTVLYTGESGTERSGIEYAWANYNSTYQWVPIGVDPSVYAKADLSNVPSASTSAKGVVQLADSTSSTATDKAATPNSVKQAYDLANSKQDTINDLASIRAGATAGSTALQASDVSSTYSPSGTSPVNGTAVSEATTPLKTEIGAVANSGAKNHLRLTESSGTTSGVNWTVDPTTGVVTAVRSSGTSESTKLIAEFNLKAGVYIFTAYPNASFTTADSFITSGGTTLARDIDGYQEFTLTQDATVRISCRIRSDISEAEFKPMIRPAAITDSSFQSYAPSNRELYEMILALQQNGGA